jgi:hypothetical protein
MYEVKMTPAEMEQCLRESPPENRAAVTNPVVNLGYYDGCFFLSWTAGNIGDDDWVGIFKNDDASDGDYISGQWQWAKKSSPFRTSVEMKAGYQARYLIYHYGQRKYISVARTDPFPAINVRVVI